MKNKYKWTILLASLLILVITAFTLKGEKEGGGVITSEIEPNTVAKSTQVAKKNSLPDFFVGSWNLTDFNIQTSEKFPKRNKFTIKESIWADLENGTSLLEINKNGKIEFSLDEKPAISEMEVIDEKELKIEFTSGANKSYTLFDYKKDEAENLVISREDPMVMESYTFSKNQ